MTIWPPGIWKTYGWNESDYSSWDFLLVSYRSVAITVQQLHIPHLRLTWKLNIICKWSKQGGQDYFDSWSFVLDRFGKVSAGWWSISKSGEILVWTLLPSEQGWIMKVRFSCCPIRNKSWIDVVKMGNQSAIPGKSEWKQTNIII